MTTVVGVDPGKTGALALVGDAGWHAMTDMPVLGKRVAAQMVADWLLEYKVNVGLIVIEGVSASPQMGVTGAFSFGRSLGVVEGAAAVLARPIEMPPPSKWKRDMGLSSDKDAARAMAVHLWPDRSDWITRKKDDGRAEAALLAEWGRRLLVERGQA